MCGGEKEEGKFQTGGGGETPIRHASMIPLTQGEFLEFRSLIIRTRPPTRTRTAAAWDCDVIISCL